MANLTLIKLPVVLEKTAISRSSMNRAIERGDFPKPIRLNPNGRAVAWVESEVDEWIEQRIEASRQQGAA